MKVRRMRKSKRLSGAVRLAAALLVSATIGVESSALASVEVVTAFDSEGTKHMFVKGDSGPNKLRVTKSGITGRYVVWNTQDDQLVPLGECRPARLPGEGVSNTGPVACPPDPKIVIEAAAGNDEVYVAYKLETPVTMRGEQGADELRGGGGNDVLDGGPGADSLRGGRGNDTVDYSSRSESAPVSVTIGDNGTAASGNDGGTADGPAGTRDNVQPSIENIIGGSGDDHLVGDADENILLGGRGSDVIETFDADCTGIPIASVPQTPLPRGSCQGGQFDIVVCGPGTDNDWFADWNDMVVKDGNDACERSRTGSVQDTAGELTYDAGRYDNRQDLSLTESNGKMLLKNTQPFLIHANPGECSYSADAQGVRYSELICPKRPLNTVVTNGAGDTIDARQANVTTSVPARVAVYAGGGDDVIYGTNVATLEDLLYGEEGRDQILGYAGPDVILGGPNPDGSPSEPVEDEQLVGGLGDDHIFGGPGPDYVSGEGGDDWLYGGLTDDPNETGTGDDFIFGGPDRDRVYGGDGVDEIDVAKDGRDDVWCGLDFDHVIADPIDVIAADCELVER